MITDIEIKLQHIDNAQSEIRALECQIRALKACITSHAKQLHPLAPSETPLLFTCADGSPAMAIIACDDDAVEITPLSRVSDIDIVESEAA